MTQQELLNFKRVLYPFGFKGARKKVLVLSEIIKYDAGFPTIPNTWAFEAFSLCIPTMGYTT
jgi:hypothetical protein